MLGLWVNALRGVRMDVTSRRYPFGCNMTKICLEPPLDCTNSFAFVHNSDKGFSSSILVCFLKRSIIFPLRNTEFNERRKLFVKTTQHS